MDPSTRDSDLPDNTSEEAATDPSAGAASRARSREGSKSSVGFISDWIDELIIWLVCIPFLPAVLRERWRRRRERRAGTGAAREQAVEEAVGKVLEKLDGPDNENDASAHAAAPPRPGARVQRERR